jgi:hypothetical protein
MIHPKSLMWTGVLGVVLFAVAVYIGDSRKPVLEGASAWSFGRWPACQAQ